MHASTGEVAYVDPLQSALDRGSEALNFINSPLVLDYIHVKFSCTLPGWTSGNPFNYIINEGFYLYDTSASIDQGACNSAGDAESQLKESILSGAFLLRYAFPQKGDERVFSSDMFVVHA